MGPTDSRGEEGKSLARQMEEDEEEGRGGRAQPPFFAANLTYVFQNKSNATQISHFAKYRMPANFKERLAFK